ncbi:response regulator [Telmatocola sphagniphila]|uniref:Response regulator n=1 Tax=Telmatocola sphagniphila TaxID=1123043 RepID=A0A8E6B738_9BACT|nr:response regulator [Telmatocola sphagniphila]QVL32376.1 response regulator [Telmatocola sphagniphila]
MPKLLVVDNEPELLHSIEQALRSENLDVVGVRSGQEAFEILRRLQPDVVMIDVQLKDVSGLDLFEWIKDLYPRLPVVFLTNQADAETAIEVMKRGAYEYLVKPLDFALLQDILQRALELHRPSAMPIVEKKLSSFSNRFTDVMARTTKLLQAREPNIYRSVTDEVDRAILEVVLNHVNGNQLQASELLGISRTTLRLKLRSLGICKFE